jgi:hypothetical protein
MPRKSLIPALLLLALVAGCNSAGLNTQAAADKQKDVVSYLQKLETQQPDTAALVDDVIRNWNTRTEREDYNLSVPLLRQYGILHPERADNIERIIRNWDKRLTEFNQ